MDYSEILAAVEDRARLSGSEEARRVIEAVLRTAISLMPPQSAAVLLEPIPDSLKPAAAAAPPQPSDDAAELVKGVARAAGCTAERARYYIQAVFQTLAEHHPSTGDVLSRQWPEELLHSPGADVPRGPHSAAGYGGPRVADADKVTKWLAAHPQWAGDTRRVQRTATLPPDRLPPGRYARSWSTPNGASTTARNSPKPPTAWCSRCGLTPSTASPNST